MIQQIHIKKQAQLATMSVFALLLALLVFYSTETPNIFNTQVSYSYVIDSIEIQFCEHSINSPQGILLNSSLSEFDEKMEQYCEHESADCSLNSYIKTNPPSNNIGLLNYTHIALNYNFTSDSKRIRNEEVIC